MPRTSRAVECAFAVLVGATSLGATCVPNPNDHTPGGGGVDMAVAELGWADIEKDLKDSGAKGCGAALPVCHSPTSTKSKLKLGADSMANYQLVKTMFVDLATPAQSTLLLKATNTTMHDGAAVFPTGDPLYDKWLKWITAGAVFDPSQKPVVYADIEKDMTDNLRCGTTLGACHSAGAAKAKLKIGPDKAANYQLVKGMFLDLMTPAQSLLLTKATNTAMHDGGAVFPTTDALYTRWLGWISGGAQEK